MRDLIEVADYLDALSTTEAHAKNRKGARALAAAAKLLRARNDQEATEPTVYICPNCEFLVSPGVVMEPDDES